MFFVVALYPAEKKSLLLTILPTLFLSLISVFQLTGESRQVTGSQVIMLPGESFVTRAVGTITPDPAVGHTGTDSTQHSQLQG